MLASGRMFEWIRCAPFKNNSCCLHFLELNYRVQTCKTFTFANVLFWLAAFYAWLLHVSWNWVKFMHVLRSAVTRWNLKNLIQSATFYECTRAYFPHQHGCRLDVQLFKGSCCCFALENSQKVLSNRPFHASKSGNGSVLRLVLSTPAVSTKVVTIIICLSISREVLVSFRSFARCLPYNQMLFSINPMDWDNLQWLQSNRLVAADLISAWITGGEAKVLD